MTETKNKTEKLEREYVIPLRHRWRIVPRYQRTNKAVRTVKEFLVKHMKIRDRDLDKIKIEKSLNELIWMRGIKNPPAKVKVKAIRDGEIVRVEGLELPERLKFKKLREEKIESSAKEIAKKKKSEKVAEEKVDENKDGVEDKKAEEEKKEAVIEAGKEIEEKLAKQEKHTTKVMTPKQEKNQQTQYNKSGRGH